ncbi:MAG: CHAP domain-containing protein [Vulcanimicrobiaceae bacterium]
MTDCSSYPTGQCTWYVCSNWSAPVGPYWGDAHTWLTSAGADGYEIVSAPAVGAIAVWGPNAGGAGAAGHVAIVISVVPGGIDVKESNWSQPFQPDERLVWDLSVISGYILPAKVTAPEPEPTPEPATEPAPEPATGVDGMGIYLSDDDARREKVRSLYRDLLCREVENETAMDAWVAYMTAHGVDQTAAAIEDGPEATAVMVARRKLLGLG